jgi:very-short-patch-repair endonuclease
LAIELEGGIHKKKEVQIYDKYRFDYLEAIGVRIIRIENGELTKNMSKVNVK